MQEQGRKVGSYLAQEFKGGLRGSHLGLEGWVRLRLVSGMKWGCMGKGAEEVNGLDLCVADRHKDPRGSTLWDCLGTDVPLLPVFFSGRRADAGLNTPPPPVRETSVIKLPFP